MSDSRTNHRGTGGALGASLVCFFLSAGSAGAQSVELIPQSAQATVGDPIAFTMRVRRGQGDALTDPVPRPRGGLPPGVRILSADSLRRAGDGTWLSTLRIAFYRPGRQSVPVLTLAYRRGVVVLGAVLETPPVTIDIVPMLPPGNPALKDIKDLVPLAGPRLWPLAIALIAAGWFGARWLRKRRRRRPELVATVQMPLPAPVPPTPYETAIARIAEIQRADWPARGQVARHYEAVADVLRGYLEEAEGVPAEERTTAELLWLLPPHLTEGGLRTRCHEVLAEADLVKFAEVRPDRAAADTFSRSARALLDEWCVALGARREVVDALR